MASVNSNKNCTPTPALASTRAPSLPPRKYAPQVVHTQHPGSLLTPQQTHQQQMYMANWNNAVSQSPRSSAYIYTSAPIVTAIPPISTGDPVTLSGPQQDLNRGEKAQSWNFKYAKARYAFDTQGDEFLSFEKGDIIEILGKEEENYYVGKNTRTGEEGHFPAKYVQLLQDHEVPPILPQHHLYPTVPEYEPMYKYGIPATPMQYTPATIVYYTGDSTHQNASYYVASPVIQPHPAVPPTNEALSSSMTLYQKSQDELRSSMERAGGKQNDAQNSKNDGFLFDDIDDCLNWMNEEQASTANTSAQNKPPMLPERKSSTQASGKDGNDSKNSSTRHSLEALQERLASMQVRANSISNGKSSSNAEKTSGLHHHHHHHSHKHHFEPTIATSSSKRASIDKDPLSVITSLREFVDDEYDPDALPLISLEHLHNIDRYARSLQFRSKQTIAVKTFCGKLFSSKVLKTPIDKLRAYFTWIVENIKYDENCAHDDNAEDVLFTRTSGVEGFANLFMAMAESSNIEAYKIRGFVKGDIGSIGITNVSPGFNHAWNVVRLDNGSYRMFDTAIASPTHPLNPRNVLSVFNETLSRLNNSSSGNTHNNFDNSQLINFYFMARPQEFIFTHFPIPSKESASHRDQFLVPPVSAKTFVELLHVTPEFFEVPVLECVVPRGPMVCLKSDGDKGTIVLDVSEEFGVWADVVRENEVAGVIQGEGKGVSGSLMWKRTLVQRKWLHGKKVVEILFRGYDGDFVVVSIGKKKQENKQNLNPYKPCLIFRITTSKQSPRLSEDSKAAIAKREAFVYRHTTPYDLYIAEPHQLCLARSKVYKFIVQHLAGGDKQILRLGVKLPSAEMLVELLPKSGGHGSPLTYYTGEFELDQKGGLAIMYKDEAGVWRPLGEYRVCRDAT